MTRYSKIEEIKEIIQNKSGYTNLDYQAAILLDAIFETISINDIESLREYLSED